MTSRKVLLIDASRHVVATAEVADEGTHFGGSIDLSRTPPAVRALFDELEEIVNGQMFSFLDAIEGKIQALSVRAVFDDGREVDVKGLQVYPTSRDVSS